MKVYSGYLKREGDRGTGTGERVAIPVGFHRVIFKRGREKRTRKEIRGWLPKKAFPIKRERDLWRGTRATWRGARWPGKGGEEEEAEEPGGGGGGVWGVQAIELVLRNIAGRAGAVDQQGNAEREEDWK